MQGHQGLFYDQENDQVELKQIGNRIFRIYNFQRPKPPQNIQEIYSKNKIISFQDDELDEENWDNSCPPDQFEYQNQLSTKQEGDKTSKVIIQKDESNGMFVSSKSIDPEFYKFIIGKKGATREKIQKQTGCFITIPHINSNSNKVVVKGLTEDSVRNGLSRLDILIASMKSSLPYNYFLSIPLIGCSKIKDFYDSLDQSYIGKVRGYEPSLQINISKFHITILMLRLYSDEEKEKAKKIMRECSPIIYDILGTRSLIVNINGVEIMNDDPREVHVLYAQIHDPSGVLPKITECLITKFHENGLVEDPLDVNVKFHATLLNTRYRSEKNESSTQNPNQPKNKNNNNNNNNNKNQIKRESFDGFDILKNYQNYDFGKVKVDSIHLSKRGELDPSGYYGCASSIRLP